MPSGAKKRKAAKKQMKNGEAHNSNDQHNNNISLTTHSQGKDDPKSFDERESDTGEVEREKEETGVEGEAENRKGLSKEVVKITSEEIAVVVGETKYAENAPDGIECSAVDVVKETPIAVLTSEGSIPSSGCAEAKVPVEEEKSIITESEQLKGQDDSSVLESNPGDEMPKPVDFVPQDTIGVEGSSVEPVKGVVTVPQEINAGSEDPVTSEVVESVLMENADTALKVPDEKEKFSSVLEDLSPERIETKTVSMDADKSLVATVVDASSGENAVNVFETSKQLEDQVVAPAATTTQMVESVKNGETLEHSDDKVSSTVVNSSCEVGNVKDMETEEQSMNQPLIGSKTLPVRKTSWMGCCGLFEVFSGANR